jgi:hypothetical protein
MGKPEGGSRRREQVDRGGAAGEDAQRGLVGIGLEGSPGRGAISAMFCGPRLLHHVRELVGEDVVTVLAVRAAALGLVVVAAPVMPAVLAEIDAEIDGAALEMDVVSSGEGLLACRHLGAVGVDLDIVEAPAEQPLHAIEGRRGQRVVARLAIARGRGSVCRIGGELRIRGGARRGIRRRRGRALR